METPLPFVTPGMPGTGGSIKLEPAHFIVEELPLYPADGQGEHIYLNITRQGMTTREVVSRLSELLGVEEGNIGYAGLKDKQALTSQTFSLWLPGVDPDKAAARASSEPALTVNWASRHKNKLRPGHLLGNRFQIVLSGPDEGALEKARAIADAIEAGGLPNFFGAQRFGRMGDNAERGKEAVLGKGPRKKWLRKLLLSAYQSELFNRWLAQRVDEGLFNTLLQGDVAKKTDTGGLFTVEDLQAESPRLAAGEITYTGPIYGAKMRWAEGPAGQREERILLDEGLDQDALKKAKLSGSRRAALLRLDKIGIERRAEGLALSFALPGGSYATVLMREIMKAETELPE